MPTASAKTKMPPMASVGKASGAGAATKMPAPPGKLPLKGMGGKPKMYTGNMAGKSKAKGK